MQVLASSTVLFNTLAIPKIPELDHAPFRQKNILGLDVSVEDLPVVDVFQSEDITGQTSLGSGLPGRDGLSVH